MKPIEINKLDDFIVFLTDLQANLDDHPEEWENNNLSNFLKGLKGYLNDTKSFSSSGLNYSELANLLLAARVYE